MSKKKFYPKDNSKRKGQNAPHGKRERRAKNPRGGRR